MSLSGARVGGWFSIRSPTARLSSALDCARRARLIGTAAAQAQAYAPPLPHAPVRKDAREKGRGSGERREVVQTRDGHFSKQQLPGTEYPRARLLGAMPAA